MADFNRFLPILLKFEGGYVDDPADPGGATNKGITFVVFKHYAKSLLGIEPTLVELKHLTDEQAAKIYKPEYWDRIRGDDITFQPLADIVCDFYVNAGGHAIKLLFQVMNALGGNHIVTSTVDASVIESLKHFDVHEVYVHYKAGRIAYYRNLAQEHPALRKFLKGWLNRAESF